MATYTSNYAWTKPGGNDQVDISVLNGNLDSQDAIMHKAFGNMAQAFSQLSTYAVGDIVLYDNDLYKCHTAVVTPGSWTDSTNWTSWTLAEGGGGGGTSDYTDLINKPSINGVTLLGNKTTSELGISYNDLTNKPSLATVATSGSYADLSSKPQVNGVELSGNKTTSDLGINADNVMMSDGVTSVEDAVDEVAGEIEKIIVRNGTVRVTGVPGNWAYMNVTFVTPFKKQPLVTVSQFSTGTGNSWYPPILKNISTNGFTAGWYNASGTNEIIWQAVGVN